ncbi:SDR family NAD(P)-dependent oxidoreductase [Hamadaea tsunoensis]|uniref:SDR family NAD(P)-dependent oxidoreductase n=1 Tax=Hamadaea tsunoensis TaxID=53368 RepID=UPI0005518103|nr:SDR family oxidoreductase [Hamadaea tsunoensis]
MEKLAVVSGGGTGIGAAIATTLATDGYAVLIVGRRPEPLAKVAASHPNITPVVADVADPARVTAVAEAVGEREVDVLVNNAGGFVMSTGDTLADLATQWRGAYDTNVLTAVLLTEALLPRLRRPGGRVILFSSIAAQRGGGGPYSAAKAALHGWVFDLAAQLGPDGVTANVISPGYIADTEFFGTRMTPEGHASRVGQTLVGRAGRPDDIAAAVSWLAGESGGYVTGQIINVNGGSVLGR